MSPVTSHRGHLAHPKRVTGFCSTTCRQSRPPSEAFPHVRQGLPGAGPHAKAGRGQVAGGTIPATLLSRRADR